MAESFMFSIAEKVLEKVGSVSLQETALAWGVKSDLKKLEGTLSTIKAVLLDAEEKQAQNCQLSIWLGRLKDVCYDVEDVLDEVQYEVLRQQVVTHGSFKTKVRNYFSHSNLILRFKVAHKIKEIRESLYEIADDKAKFHLTERSEDRSFVHRKKETYSFVHALDVIGRHDDKKKIIELLVHPGDGENVSIIPIVGIGGVGKTTLAKLVYSDESVVKHFEFKMWVCVSEDFDFKKLTKEIAKSATGETCDNLTIDSLQSRLRSTLDNKKFLLILDDIWNEDREKWFDLKNLLMVGAKGSKVIVTTRNHSVGFVMGSIHAYNLKGLSNKECLSLFVKWAFKEGEEKKYPNLLKIGDEIVKKCRGVPLAARTLGSLLYLKIDERDWLFVKDNEIWKLEQKTEDILPALRLSYDHLPSYLKQCFAICSIFPKNFEFYRVDLVQLWIAQGLLRSSNEHQELEDIGERYIDELRSRSFFEDVENYDSFLKLKMHDVMHDLALLVAKTECCTINSDTCTIYNRVRQVSFSRTDLSLDEVPRFLLKLDNLRTILFPIWRVRPTSKSFVETCISRFKSLRVLVLSCLRLEVLPSSIGNLKHLRYLDLCHNPTIKKLPNSICKLHNLQNLRLHGCYKLEELPRDIGNLINLRFLHITTKQMFLPVEGIGRLNSLRFLGIWGCGNLKSLGEGLQRLTALRTLAIRDCKNLESLPCNMKYLTALETLVIEYCENLNLIEWEEDIQCLKCNIRSLFIRELPELVALPQWLQQAANTLQLLHIESCYSLTTLPEWLQNLTSLQKLVIKNCHELSALPEGMHRLTALRELKMKGCSLQLSRRCESKKGEDWPKIAHVPEITLEDKIDSESHSRPDDTLIPRAEYERLQQEIARLKEENMVLQDMVSRRLSRDEAGPSGTASVPEPPSPSTAVPSQT